VIEMMLPLSIMAVLALTSLFVGDANLVCNTNFLPSTTSLGPVLVGTPTNDVPAVYVFGQSYIWNSVSNAGTVNSSACLTVTATGSAFWYAPGLAKQTGIITGTFGIGLQQAMGETLSDSNSISCSGVSAFNQSTTFNLLSEIQTRIQANLYGTSSIYGYMNSILNVYNLQCCDSFSGCNQAVAMTVGPFNGDKSRVSFSSTTLLGSVVMSILFMKMMISN